MLLSNYQMTIDSKYVGLQNGLALVSWENVISVMSPRHQYNAIKYLGKIFIWQTMYAILCEVFNGSAN